MKSHSEIAREILSEHFYECSIPENVVTIWYQQTVEAIASAISTAVQEERTRISELITDLIINRGTAERSFRNMNGHELLSYIKQEIFHNSKTKMET